MARRRPFLTLPGQDQTPGAGFSSIPAADARQTFSAPPKQASKVPSRVLGASFFDRITDPEFIDLGGLRPWLTNTVPIDVLPIEFAEVTPVVLALYSDGTVELRNVEIAVPPGEEPNGNCRARIEFQAGSADAITFDCDWRGTMQLIAKRVVVRRLAQPRDWRYPPNPEDFRGWAHAHPGFYPSRDLPTLTLYPKSVGSGASRAFELPPFASRLSLLQRYGGIEYAPELDITGDAPLGQIFVCFLDGLGKVITWIDAQSAKVALFGDGLVIPFGARFVALSNLSADTTVQLGCILRLAGF